MLVICEERCWDSKSHRIYNVGDQGDIEPLSPLAKYFGGWLPGTKVYIKSKGVAGTMIIPGGKSEEKKPDEDTTPEENDAPKRGRPRTKFD